MSCIDSEQTFKTLVGTLNKYPYMYDTYVQNVTSSEVVGWLIWYFASHSTAKFTWGRGVNLRTGPREARDRTHDLRLQSLTTTPRTPLFRGEADELVLIVGSVSSIPYFSNMRPPWLRG